MTSRAKKRNSFQRKIRRVRSIVMVLTFLAAVFASYKLVMRKSLPPLPVLGQVPNFSFVTQENAPFSDTDMLGQVSIANFIFTRCPSICPVFSMKMQRIGERVPGQVQLISFSVDPDYDTPERLAEYAARFDADPKRWHFLTGDHKTIQETVEGGLKISMEFMGRDQDGIPDIAHGSHFVLFDRQGQIRGYYNSEDVDRIDALVHDSARLIAE